MRKPAPRWWWEVLPLALLVSSFAYLAAVYPELPERVPTHFGPTGLPDAWGGKGSLFTLPFIQLGLYLLNAVIYFWMARVPDPRRLITNYGGWSAREKAAFTDEMAENFRRTTVRGLWAMNLLLMLMLTHLHVAGLQTALGRRPGLGLVMVWVYLVAVVVGSLWLTVKMFLAARPRLPREF